MPPAAPRLACLLAVGLVALAPAAEPSPADRGRKALTEQNFVPPFWSYAAFENAWKRWDGVRDKPADYPHAFADHYGLAAAPYPNGDLPMGLREGKRLLSRGVSVNCLTCHGGSILGQNIVGLGNASVDIAALFEDLSVADGIPYRSPFRFGRVRGTTEAGGMALYLLAMRNPDLSLRVGKSLDFGLRDDLIEDAPAWWLLKKKRTMYHTGGADARSVRSIMQFMMSPLNGPAAFERAEEPFRDIQQYLLSIDAPKYPYPVNAELAAQGKALYASNCAKCHGIDGSYPNRVVPLAEIGTDRSRFDGITPAFGEYYNKSWFAQEHGGWTADGYKSIVTDGYQAPPLDGVWATAPYFHNGSVPTLEGVLNSAARPARFTRSYRTGADDYDAGRVGWKVRVLDRPAADDDTLRSRRLLYDTTQPGRGNAGHTYGDAFDAAERRAVIEYLKTL